MGRLAIALGLAIEFHISSLVVSPIVIHSTQHEEEETQDGFPPLHRIAQFTCQQVIALLTWEL